MKQSALDCPRTEAVNVGALRYCNGAILMPTERPVCGRRLVEQDRSHFFISLPKKTAKKAMGIIEAKVPPGTSIEGLGQVTSGLLATLKLAPGEFVRA